MILVSGCLVGQKCRYNMISEEIKELKDLIEKGEAIPVCPEQLGGLPTPRPPQEIRGGDGTAVLKGHAKVINSEGRDVTQAFVKGASDCLVIAKDRNVDKIIFKSRSPACGIGEIYDGTFSGKVRKGDGVATALLKKHGFVVIDENGFVSSGLEEGDKYG